MEAELPLQPNCPPISPTLSPLHWHKKSLWSALICWSCLLLTSSRHHERLVWLCPAVCDSVSRACHRMQRSCSMLKQAIEYKDAGLCHGSSLCHLAARDTESASGPHGVKTKLFYQCGQGDGCIDHISRLKELDSNCVAPSWRVQLMQPKTKAACIKCRIWLNQRPNETPNMQAKWTNEQTKWKYIYGQLLRAARASGYIVWHQELANPRNKRLCRSSQTCTYHFFGTCCNFWNVEDILVQMFVVRALLWCAPLFETI